MKQSRKILCGLLLCHAVVTGLAQNKDCKFSKAKDASGKIIQVIEVPTRVGKLIVRKNEGKFYLNYWTKAIFVLAADDNNTTELRIDSVAFYAGAVKNTMPAIGKGDIKNEIKLKNTFEYIQFEVELNEAMVAKFTTSKMTEFFVYGEKQAGYRDELAQKNQDKLTNAFGCF